MGSDQDQETTMNALSMLETTIARASEIAVELDATQIIGRIGGEWQIADLGDEGRIYQMAAPTFRVDSAGITATAAEMMDAMERAGIEGDQDWSNESTTYDIGDDTITVSGQIWTINQQA